MPGKIHWYRLFSRASQTPNQLRFQCEEPLPDDLIQQLKTTLTDCTIDLEKTDHSGHLTILGDGINTASNDSLTASIDRIQHRLNQADLHVELVYVPRVAVS